MPSPKRPGYGGRGGGGFTHGSSSSSGGGVAGALSSLVAKPLVFVGCCALGIVLVVLVWSASSLHLKPSSPGLGTGTPGPLPRAPGVGAVGPSGVAASMDPALQQQWADMDRRVSENMHRLESLNMGAAAGGTGDGGADAAAAAAAAAAAGTSGVVGQGAGTAGDGGVRGATSLAPGQGGLCASELAECRNAAALTATTIRETMALSQQETSMLTQHVEALQRQLASCSDQAVLAQAALESRPASCPPQEPCPAQEPCPQCPEPVTPVAPPVVDAGGGGDGGMVSARDAQAMRRQHWLVIGMPSTPRVDGADYLNPTLDYLLEQLPADPLHPLFGKVLIVVMNNGHGKTHDAFDAAEARMQSHPKGSNVHFTVNGPQPDPLGDKQDAGTVNKPGSKVRQQTRDVASLLEYAHGMGEYYMFMEDDFRLCPSAMMALQYVIDKANRVFPNWILIRTCFGLNGATIHDEDMPFLASYYREHQARRPPDHMLVEWFAGEREQSKAYVGDRKHIAFRYNLFEHIGYSSSLRSSKSPKYAVCYDELVDGVLFEVEAFKPNECKHEDIWPCPRGIDHEFPAVNWGSLKDKVERVGRFAGK